MNHATGDNGEPVQRWLGGANQPVRVVQDNRVPFRLVTLNSLAAFESPSPDFSALAGPRSQLFAVAAQTAFASTNTVPTKDDDNLRPKFRHRDGLLDTAYNRHE